jgi:hypothetical protein
MAFIMNALLAQLIISARNNDIEGWMNILIVVIIAIFWAIGGIIKAKSQKAHTEQEEQPTGKPVHKWPHSAKELKKRSIFETPRTRTVGSGPIRQYRRQVEKLRRKINHPRPTASGIVDDKTAMPITLAQAFKEPKYSKVKPDIQPINEEHKEKEFEGELIKDFSLSSAGKDKLEIPFESLLDYTNPDELRRAILHYEILGKPLSLRRKGEHII